MELGNDNFGSEGIRVPGLLVHLNKDELPMFLKKLTSNLLLYPYSLEPSILVRTKE